MSPTNPRASAAPAKRASKTEATKPFLRFYHSESLRKKTLTVIAAIESADDATDHGEALAELVVELSNTGLDYYFMKPLQHAKTGFLVEQSAKLGMAGVQQVMGRVTRNIIGRMDPPQLLSVCGSIRQLML